MPVSDLWQEDTDPEIPGQMVAVVSMMGPDLHQKCEIPAFKIRGVFATEEQAKKRVEYLKTIEQASEFTADIYFVDMGKWIPMKFNLDDAKDVVEYDNPVLDELMKGFRTNLQQGKKMFEERKRKLREGKVLSSDLELMMESMKKEKADIEKNMTDLHKKIEELKLKEEQEKEEEEVADADEDKQEESVAVEN